MHEAHLPLHQRNDEEVELKVDTSGGIVGACLDQLKNLPGVSQAHCQIKSQK